MKRKLNFVLAEVRRLKKEDETAVLPDMHALHSEAFEILVNEGLEMLEIMQKVGDLEHRMMVTEEAMANCTGGPEARKQFYTLRNIQVQLAGEQALFKKQIDQWCEELATPDNDG